MKYSERLITKVVNPDNKNTNVALYRMLYSGEAFRLTV
jgi:hypothetical protein